MLEINKIYNEDCLEGMKKIDDKSVDCIITDLPYGQLNKKRNHAKKCDELIPLNELWKQYNRIIKENGAIVLFANGMFTADLMKSNEKMWRYNLIWKKGERTTGFLNAKKMPMRNHEDMVVFYKKLPTYNPQMVKCEPHKRNHSRGNLANADYNNVYGDYKEIPSIISDEKYPKSIINIQPEHKECYHPSQKPVELIKWLIRTYTNPGDLVLDSCAGSCTTAIAALNTSRNYICFEKDKDIFEIGSRRVAEYKGEINDRK